MTRLQIITREAVASSRPSDPDAARGVARTNSPKVSIGLVFIEAEPGQFIDEAAYSLRFSMRPGKPLSLAILADPVTADDAYGYDTPILDDEVTGAYRFMTATSAEGVEALLPFGKVFLRRTGMPVGAGKEGFVGFALMVGTKAIPERTMFTLEGLPGDLEETFRQEIPGAFEIGSDPSATFRQPIWGFETKSRAFQSTMAMSVIGVCEEYENLRFRGDLTPEEDARKRALEETLEIRSVYGVSQDDAEYQDFLAFLFEAGGLGEGSGIGAYPTTDELAAVQARHAEIFGRWHAGREADRAPGMR